MGWTRERESTRLARDGGPSDVPHNASASLSVCVLLVPNTKANAGAAAPRPHAHAAPMGWCANPGAREAYLICWISLVCTVIAIIVGFIVFVQTESSATLGFALENLVDTISSLLVLWRFWGGGATVPEEELDRREKRADVGIAVSFVALAFIVGSDAVDHLTEREATTNTGALFALSGPSIVIFLVLGCVKMHLGLATNSQSLIKDASCSICGALLSVGTCVGAALVSSGSGIWYVDAVVAVVISEGLLVFGMYTLVTKAKYKWWTAGFWRTPTERRANRAKGKGLFGKSAATAPRSADMGQSVELVSVSLEGGKSPVVTD